MNSQIRRVVAVLCLLVGSSVARLRRQNYHGDFNPITFPYSPVGPPYTLQTPYNTRPSFRRTRPSSHLTLHQESEYGYKYGVDAPDYGTKFGLMEQREGEVARGKYYVLLPDGRTQIVEYTADQDGYHPTINYQGGRGGGYQHTNSYPRQSRVTSVWQDY